MTPFPGARPFIAAAAADLGLSAVDTHQATRLDPVRKAEQVLGQLANARPEHRAEIVKNVRRWRGQLAAALAGLDAALASLEPTPEDEAPAASDPKPSRPKGRNR